MLSLVHKAASPGLGLLRPSHSGPDQAPASTSAGWNKSGTWKMLPYKKRRTTLRESAQHQGNQEEDDVDLQADEEANDDHPEYNFLEELDEPDAKDFCTDQAVRITTYRLPYLLKQVAWILATSKVFMYPELLPVCL
nr:GON-4-like protein isoform X8 [Bubalus bubalis]